MAYNKSLELRRLQPKETFLGNYVQANGKNYRDFRPGDFLYSTDGFTKYLVQTNGSIRKVT